jgi:DNA-binding NtrC family response regulator
MGSRTALLWRDSCFGARSVLSLDASRTRTANRAMINFDIAQLIQGNSMVVQHVRERIAKVAPTRLAVLIEGPTGSGKELVAQALHRASSRAGPFVAFNVCAVSEGMFEDALFGHVRGAFTGAMAEVRGYLLEADRGTVFLDEISGLALPMQAKLLRALETGRFRPVGGAVDRASDFRVVSASNEPLDRMVADGRFRADLAQRLAAVRITVPPLAARLEDVPVLARHFLSEAAQLYDLAGILTDGALRVLQSYEWPGNVRELKHVVTSALVLAAGPRITGEDVSAVLREARHEGPLDRAMATQRQQLVELLEAVGWSRERAALRLGVHPVTVYRRMKRLGISAPSALRRQRPPDRGEHDCATLHAVAVTTCNASASTAS